MAKPTKFPEWAVNDVVDPTSEQNNVVEPSGAKKLLGWDFKEFPPRQYFNWLSRLINNWIVWFDSLLDQGVKVGDNPEFNSVKLGSASPQLKVKKITGTSPSGQGTQGLYPHGLTGIKIIGWLCFIEVSTGLRIAPDLHPDLSGSTYYDCYLLGTDFSVDLASAPDSVFLTSKPLSITIFYEP